MKGYEKLDDVLARAFKQASQGKGKERHANDFPFHEQPMQQVNRMVGVGFSHGQAIKKIVESQNMPPEQAVHELLGAICYLAGSIITLEAANDNQPMQSVSYSVGYEPDIKFEPIMKNETAEYLDENYQLIEAAIGNMFIPDNWIRVPEGAMYLMNGFKGELEAFYDKDFKNVYPLNDSNAWVKCWIGLEDLKSNGGVIVWQRETPRDQAEERAFHEALEQFKHQAETVSPFTWESKNFGMVTVDIIGGLCRVTRCGHHVINRTDLKEVFEHLEG